MDEDREDKLCLKSKYVLLPTASMNFQKTYNDFFAPNDNYHQECELIDCSRRTPWIIRLLDHLARYLTPINFKISGSDDSEKLSQVCSLQFYNPIVRDIRDIVKIPIRILLSYAIIIILLIVSLMAGTWLQAFQKAMELWKPQVKSGTNRTEFCALRENIFDPNPRYQIISHQIYRGLLRIGISSVASTDFASFSLIHMAITLATLLCFALIHSNRRFPLAASLFSTSPLESRLNMRQNLAKLVNKESRGAGHKELLHVRYIDACSKIVFMENSDYLSAQDCSCKLSNQRDQIEFAKFLKSQRIIDQVKPASQSLKCLQKIQVAEKYSSYFFILSSIMVATITAVCITIIEGYERVNQRLRQLECETWHPNGTLIKDIFEMEPLEKESEIVAYKNFDGSIMSYVGLMAGVEIPKFVKLSVILSSTAFMVYILIIISWLTFYARIFSAEFISCLVWLGQLRSQLDKCKKLLEISCYYRHQVREASSDGKNNVELEKRILRNQYRAIERVMVIAYLNNELILANFGPYQGLGNFLARQFVVLASLNIGVCTIVQTSTTVRLVTLTWLLTMASILSLSLFALMCSNLTNQFICVSKAISNLLANASYNSMELRYIVKLWRRHLMRSSEVRALYSIEAFGVQMSHKNLLTFNTSIFGIWLLINR